MTVYVDDARIKWVPPHRPNQVWTMSHLFADSLLELNAFADGLGLNHRWLQMPPKASWIHFDVTEMYRKRAVAMGAIEISYRRDLVRMIRERPWLKGLAQFQSIERFDMDNGDHIFVVRNDRERPRDKPGLAGTRVMVDGTVYECVGIDCFKPAFPIRVGENIAIRVRPCAS